MMKLRAVSNAFAIHFRSFSLQISSNSRGSGSGRLGVLTEYTIRSTGCDWQVADGDRTARAAAVMGLARNLSAEEMVAPLAAVHRALEAQGDADLERFMAERVDTMLELRGYSKARMEGEARTMAETVDRFRQSLDDLVQRGVRQGMRQGVRQGMRQGQLRVLRRQAARKFGEEAAKVLSELLDERSGPEGVDRVADALLESGTADEFLDRVRMAGAS